MPLVLDASVAVKLIVAEADSDRAIALLDRPDRRFAPDWIGVEVASALWNKFHRSEIVQEQVTKGLRTLPLFLDELLPANDLLHAACELALQLRHPVYDCLYLAAARRRQAVVVTADRAFAQAAERAGFKSQVELLT